MWRNSHLHVLPHVVQIDITAVYSLFAGTESHQPLSVAHPSRTTVSVISFHLKLSFIRDYLQLIWSSHINVHI